MSVELATRVDINAKESAGKRDLGTKQIECLNSMLVHERRHRYVRLS